MAKMCSGRKRGIATRFSLVELPCFQPLLSTKIGGCSDTIDGCSRPDALPNSRATIESNASQKVAALDPRA